MTDESLFAAALEKPTAIERKALLDAVCAGDSAQRQRLDLLLAGHDQDTGILDQSAVLPDSAALEARTGPPAVQPGVVLAGRYKLLEEIGEGGMGTVWIAEQTQPVRRKVAVKLVKAGMDSKTVLARFEAERQALAVMDHPSIAKVLDGGTTDAGRPFFVMELVKGVPITDFCDQNHLSPRQRLELFKSVCSAVQHAHQKGIIHRDLKPSNVLVSRHDSNPVVKVIDFGIAKALGQTLTEKTLYTGLGQMVGTPLYMSPEQAGMSDLDIDTRSDVYSLGVLLYELLTGTTPFTKERFQKAAYDEMRRIIREEEPPRPSTRLSQSQNSLPSVAAQRQTEPTKLSRLVRGELDWIVMRALEKDRNRRYETANGFALDVERYLADEPVLACPPSTGYRLRKFARKNRKVLITTGAFLLLLGAAVVVSTSQAIRATQAKTVANANADQARLNGEEAERNAQQAREEATAKTLALKAEQQAREDEAKARGQAFAALRSMTGDVIEKKFTQGTVLTEDDRAFLRGVIAQYDAFAAIKGDDADSRAARAEGRFRVANMRHTLGELNEAVKDYDQALSIQQQLAADFPSEPRFRGDLAITYNNRANLLYATGRPREAEHDRDRALSFMKQLATDFPTNPRFRHVLATAHRNRGNLLRGAGRFKEAEHDYEQALSIMKQLAAEFPSRAEYRAELAWGHNNRGTLLRNAGRFKEGEHDNEQALSIMKQLAADFPSRPEFRDLLAKAHNNRGNLLRGDGRFKDAEHDYEQALNIMKQLAADFPSRPEFRDLLAKTHNNRGTLLSITGRFKEAVHEYEQSLSIYKRLLADLPNHPDLRSELAGTFMNLAILHTEQEDWAAAKRILLEGQPHHLATLTANPRHPTYREHYRNHLTALTSTYAALLKRDDAVRTAETCRDLGWNAPADAYTAACLLSRCIPYVAKHDKLDDQQRTEAVQFYGDEAMRLLREAVSRGYGDVSELKKDPRLDPLRLREDFRRLVVELVPSRVRSDTLRGQRDEAEAEATGPKKSREGSQALVGRGGHRTDP